MGIGTGIIKHDIQYHWNETCILQSPNDYSYQCWSANLAHRGAPSATKKNTPGLKLAVISAVLMQRFTENLHVSLLRAWF